MPKKKKKKRPSDCKQKDCSGKYKLSHIDNIPIFTCNICSDQNLEWKKFYEEHLRLYLNKENWHNDRHRVACILGFFVHMYKEFYDTDYIFVPQNPNPYGAKEIKDIWKLLAAFNGNQHKVRKYIYWVFKKLINKNTNITSFGYILAPGIIRKYNIYVQKKKSLTRASKLPDEFIEWCYKNTPEAFNSYELSTVNDLGALLSYSKFYNIDESSVERLIISKAEDFSLIKDGKLNIKE